MDQKRFEQLAEAYGGDIARWPQAEREAAQALADADARAAGLLRDAAALDALLDEAPDQLPSAGLVGRIMEQAEKRTPYVATLRDVIAAAWPFGKLWQPASALVMAGLAGIIIGAQYPDLVIYEDETVTASAGGETTAYDLAFGGIYNEEGWQ